ncbi:MAG TPA: hypothetical protein VK832_18060 [Burkholderiaceae bacterium]|jgi:hypothetical protein|nr:hypothetical protein [Burkholderiaceae bacterium]
MEYEDIVNEFCEQAGISDPTSIAEGEFLEIDDVTFKFEYIAEMGCLQLHIELGELPGEVDDIVQAAMLQFNYRNDLRNAFYCIDPDSDSVFISYYLTDDMLKRANGLFFFVQSEVNRIASEWRKFLESIVDAEDHSTGFGHGESTAGGKFV